MILYRESRVHKKELLRPSTLKEIVLLSGIIKGQTFKLCGATGVKTKTGEVGRIIGPPQLNE